MANVAGTPQLAHVFGQMPVTFPGLRSIPSPGTVGPQATANAVATINGVNPNDRLAISAPAASGVGCYLMSGIAPNGSNQAQVRVGNYSSANLSPGARDASISVLENQSYRQVFAVSGYMGSDTLMCAADVQSGAATIFKTQNAFGSVYPIYTVSGALSVRQFLAINSTGAHHIAVCSDTGKVVYTLDGGGSWTDVGRLGSEDCLMCAEQQGGEFSGSGAVLVGSSSGHVWYSNDGGASFTDKGKLATDYDQVWGLIYISGSGASATYLALLNDSTSTYSPAVYEVTNYGASATPVTTLGAPGADFQGYIKTLSGAVVLGLSDAGIYRGEAPYTSFSLEFTTSAVISSETKPRSFAQWSDGTLWCVTQDGGYLWRSDDDGLTFEPEHRIGYLDSPISMRSAGNAALFIGCGQGLVTGKPFKATIYRAFRAAFP